MDTIKYIFLKTNYLIFGKLSNENKKIMLIFTNYFSCKIKEEDRRQGRDGRSYFLLRTVTDGLIVY